uniref:14.9 kDa salivary protein n=1 Tax=Phlebotomus duboscqi TaxID=37738 RepID=Q06K45_PHLDU|nr:14.9 kDa salivary protein [Phlebotomus duboscqi]
MKCLLAALLIPLLYAEIAFGFGEHPEAYCIERHKKDSDCLVHCKFKHYTFTDDQYNIKEYHIRNLADFLIKYNVVTANKKNQVEQHLRSCVESSIKRAGGHKSCDSIFYYYTCITDEKLIFFNDYDNAIRRYDQTLKVVTESRRI